MTKRDYSRITNEIEELTELCTNNCVIDKTLYEKNKVYIGLRDMNGKGVLTGLTQISDVHAKEIINGEEIPCDGKLYYRGYDIEDIIEGLIQDNRFGFEEITYLLITGNLPSKEELDNFNKTLASYRSLPNSFVRDIIMKAPSNDMMNSLARSVLTLYSYDKNPDDTGIPNVMRQCLQLIAMFPMLAVYGYQAYDYYIRDNNSFFIHEPLENLSTAENILHMLRIDSKYTKLEARILDLALILHAEHGGGNNSTFTTCLVTSTGTDTYSAVAAALGSLKGPKHGGANIKVREMFKDIKSEVRDWQDEEEIEEYLLKILHKEAFDRTGLIYGMGHAVYSLSDPRARVFKGFVEKLSEEKGLEEEYKLYANIEKIASRIISEERKIYKGVSANVDFYSGFVYDMLGIPLELFTPIFAIARIAGWGAHRIEELINVNKIIRPAYKNVDTKKAYINISHRNSRELILK
ncbi:MAG: citrate/2-methylcitrate synthase [Clostridiaceae bacterium]